MKIVVNKCYGGFGLSFQAQLKIHEEKGCSHQRIETREECFGNIPYYKTRESQDNFLQLCEVGELKGGEILFDEHEHYENRICPVLIKVVEELKEKSFGRHAELKIVEIPDDVKYEIRDYDGIETVHEEHRFW